MSEPKLRVPKRVAQQLARLHPEIRGRIRAGLDTLLANPSAGKELREELSELRSYRVGRMRIVYRVEGRVLELVAVGPRAEIYEQTVALLQEETAK
jgi:mRNA-degrading endonuclease RelE of RelBE toxin-antitoxin system